MFRTALISMFLTSAALADTWTVDDDGKADFDNIQAAVDAASDGDEIVVMPGTYTGSGDYAVNMNGKAILLRSQQGPDKTIISGQGQRVVIFCGNNETSSTTISGFKIVQGNSTFGGGMRFSGASPIVENCIFENNTAVFGGGIRALGGDTIHITDCQFRENTATFLGGAFMGKAVSVTFSGCLIRDNYADQTGGVYVGSFGGSMENSVICSNTNGQVYGVSYEGCIVEDVCETSCGDVNGDEIVNVGDLLIIIENWNTFDINADVTLDGIVDVEDILFIVSAWGTDCSPDPQGACCIGQSDPWCKFLTEKECWNYGGWYQGDGTNCGSSPCF